MLYEKNKCKGCECMIFNVHVQNWATGRGLPDPYSACANVFFTLHCLRTAPLTSILLTLLTWQKWQQQHVTSLKHPLFSFTLLVITYFSWNIKTIKQRERLQAVRPSFYPELLRFSLSVMTMIYDYTMWYLVLLFLGAVNQSR